MGGEGGEGAVLEGMRRNSVEENPFSEEEASLKLSRKRGSLTLKLKERARIILRRQTSLERSPLRRKGCYGRAGSRVVYFKEGKVVMWGVAEEGRAPSGPGGRRGGMRGI